MNNVTKSAALLPTASYTYTMIGAFVGIALCFLCSFCLILLRTMFEREKRQRRATDLQRFILNLPEIDLNQWPKKGLKETNSPVAYGHLMTMLGKSIKDMDDFKEQLQVLPLTIAEKLGKYTGNDKVEHLQRALVENQFHF